jgi:hypothetical protein
MSFRSAWLTEGPRRPNPALTAGLSQAEHMERDPDLESLRRLPRFTALVRKVRSQARAATGAAGPLGASLPTSRAFFSVKN